MRIFRSLRDKNIPEVFQRIEINYPTIRVKPPPFETFKKYWDLVEMIFVHPCNREPILDLGR